MKRRILFLSLGVLIIILLVTCRKKEKFPPEPHIDYVSFIRFGEDSAMLHINFTDGDGDIGLDAGDTNPPYNIGSEYHDNAFVKYYYQNPTGNFVMIDTTGPTINFDGTFSYRLPVITPEGKDKALKGEMIFTLKAAGGPYHRDDTVQYEVYIYDRALNKSNVVRTETIIF